MTKMNSTSDILTTELIGERLPEPVTPRGETSTPGGAPTGVLNGRYTDGRYTKEAKARRTWVRRQLLKHSQHMANVGSAEEPQLAAAVETQRANYRVATAPAGMDEETWRTTLRGSLGGGSDAFVNTMLNQLIDAAAINRDHVATSESLSAALELIRGLAPSNTAEAALAVHVAQLHMVAAALNGRILLYGSTRATRDQANAAARLERAFLAAFQTYLRIRYGTRHVVQIERITKMQQSCIGALGPTQTSRALSSESG